MQEVESSALIVSWQEPGGWLVRRKNSSEIVSIQLLV